MRAIAVVVLGSMWMWGALAPVAEAHHSFAMFDKAKFRTLEGKVARIEWTNPHTYVFMNVVEQGKVQLYTLECSSPNELSRWGWKPQTLKVGEEVKVEIFPMRDGRPAGLVVSITKADGTVLKSH